MDILYVLSDIINYNLLICDDAGPGYALSMGWKYTYLHKLKLLDTKSVIIIDNRMAVTEIDRLKNMIIENPNNMFFLKIVDPYYDNTIHHYYRFLSGVSSVKNAYLLSVYEAQELAAELKYKFKHRYIHLPYPYLKGKEINTASKKNKILISGSLNKHIYPYRYGIWIKVTRSITRLFFSILKHPGYAELNSDKGHLHMIIKDNFVKYLSTFKYMLLCPSKCGIEFLKFNECAYAGCIPVGEAPDSYPQEIKQLFLPLRSSHFLSDTLKIISKQHNFDNLLILRHFLHQTRQPDVLNKVVKDFINSSL